MFLIQNMIYQFKINFLHDNIPNLSIPNEYGEDPSLFKTFKALDNYELSKKYHTNKAKFIKILSKWIIYK